MIEYLTNEHKEKAIYLAIQQAIDYYNNYNKTVLIYTDDKEYIYDKIKIKEIIKGSLSERFLLFTAKKYQSFSIVIKDDSKTFIEHFNNLLNDVIKDCSTFDVVILILNKENIFKNLSKIDYIKYTDSLIIIPSSDTEWEDMIYLAKR